MDAYSVNPNHPAKPTSQQVEPLSAQNMADRMALQKQEFDALELLTKKWKALQMTPVVDDDYPEVRHYYESALRNFLSACKKNGRTV